MRLEGKLFKENIAVRICTVTRDDPELSFVRGLELALIDLCHAWMSGKYQTYD